MDRDERLIPAIKELVATCQDIASNLKSILDKITNIMPQYKTGRLPSDPIDLNRRLKLEKYYTVHIPPLSPSTNWRSKASNSLSTVLGNDNWGDCTVAAAGHVEGVTSANSEKAERVYTTKEIVDTYLSLTGGRDQGLNMLVMLKYWQKTGLLGHKCGPYLSIPADFEIIKSCIAMFGTVYAGFAPVPSAWLEAEIWDRPTRGGGGHAIAFVDYDEDYLYVSTWGEIRKATANALSIFDEAYVVLDPDWIKNAPNGFDSATLIKDFNELGGNEPVPIIVPPIDNPPTPPPRPPAPDPVPSPNPEPVVEGNWLDTLITIIKVILGVFK